MPSFDDGYDVNQHIDREVQRRLGNVQRQHAEEIAELRSTIEDCKNNLIRQNSIIHKLTAEPVSFGSLVMSHNFVDPDCFSIDDEVVVIDPQHEFHNIGGNIVANGGLVVDSEGYVNVKLVNEAVCRFSIGIEGKAPAQVRLTTKSDGTYAVVQSDGKPWEVKGVPDFGLKAGDPIKIRPDSKAIIAKGYDFGTGPVCKVVSLIGEFVEVSLKGDHSILFNPNNLELNEGDRVVADAGMFSVIKKLPPDTRTKYKLSADADLTWDKIGGLAEAKQDLQDALETPYLFPKLYEFYGVKPLRGVLLYGPPGCGKTLLARAAASSMARTHNKEVSESGYMYVKSPEILSKWVGETEREIVELFERARRHYRENGYKAILAFDEADAIMPERGTRRSSDVADTIVPMFLGEMDGVDAKQTEENPIVFLMTNRADVLDPAVTRPGRIDSHIKVQRPDQGSAIDIMSIHSEGIPFSDSKKKDAWLAVAVSDIFSKTRLLYRINNEYDFTLGDCVNGAMLANVVNTAKIIALRRDREALTRTGVGIDDLRQAVQKLYLQQQGVNHSFDLQDFADRHGIQAHAMKTERCFGAA